MKNSDRKTVLRLEELPNIGKDPWWSFTKEGKRLTVCAGGD